MNFSFERTSPLGAELGATKINNRREYLEACRSIAAVAAARQLAAHMEGDAEAGQILLSRFGFDAKLQKIVRDDLLLVRQQFLDAGEVDEVERIDVALATDTSPAAPRKLVLSGPKVLESIAACDDLAALDAALLDSVQKKRRAAVIDALQARIDVLRPPPPVEETAPITVEEAPAKPERARSKKTAIEAAQAPVPPSEPSEPHVVSAPQEWPVEADGTIDKYSHIVERTCPHCKETKPRDSFGSRRMPSGRNMIRTIHTWCSVCRRKSAKEAHDDKQAGRPSKRERARAAKAESEAAT